MKGYKFVTPKNYEEKTVVYLELTEYEAAWLRSVMKDVVFTGEVHEETKIRLDLWNTLDSTLRE